MRHRVFVDPACIPGGKWTEAVLYTFSGGDDGGQPNGVVAGDGGVLYGTTTGGGAFNYGAVYSLAPPSAPGSAGTETVLYSFAGGGGDGAYPLLAGVVTGSGGILYGTTSGGGTSGQGTVFSLAPPTSPGGAWTETVLYSFVGGSDGASPEAGVVIGSDGVLYGTTLGGGITSGFAGYGTVYSLTRPTSPGGPWTENLLHSFAGGSDGAQPNGGVAIGSGGVLYGTTGGGGPIGRGTGTVFSLAPPTSPGGPWTKSLLYSFAGGNDGSDPLAGVVVGNGGVLCGTTNLGGASSWGTVFSLTPPTTPGGAWTEAVLYSFAGGSDGGGPNAVVVIGSGGLLYGTTWQGENAGGTVFSLSGGPGPPAPVAVSAATGTAPVAPGSIISIYGSGLAIAGTSATMLPLPTSLGGTSVTITDSSGVQSPLPLFYAGPTQINAEIPQAATAGTATLSVITQSGSQSGSVTLAAVAPGLFSANESGAGVAAGQFVTNDANGTQIIVDVFQCSGGAGACVALPLGVSAGNSALVLYGTGIHNRASLSDVTVMIGGQTLPASYAGAAPNYAGEDQVNVLLPASLAGSGTVNVSVSVAGSVSNTVTVDIQ
jgi:uncharacterized protein (TIGR03437 family)